jgi:AcrR family transcriptional regulator
VRLRDRIIDAAALLTAEQGWTAITMSGVAERVGISRQSIYNEVGGKEALGEAVLARELSDLLDAIRSAFASHPTRLPEALQQAVLQVIVRAEGNPTLRLVLGGPAGAGDDSLAALDRARKPAIARIGETIRTSLVAYPIESDDQDTDTAVDMIVRTTVSHAIHPAEPGAGAAQELTRGIARAGCRLLGWTGSEFAQRG